MVILKISLGSQLRTQLAISSLNILQSLFLGLASGEILHFAVVEILAVVGVGVERELVGYIQGGQILIGGIAEAIVEFDCERPSSFQFAVLVKDILFAYFVFLIGEILDKFIDELVFDGQDLSLDLVSEFPFI